MNAFEDCRIVEQLHGSARSLVYRIRVGTGEMTLVQKVLAREFPSFQEIAQFKHEYAIAQRFRHDVIVRPLTLWQQGGRWTMNLEDGGGQSLRQLLQERKTASAASTPAAPVSPAIELAEFFDIALQLCAALEVVHSQGVIHKDINPSHLIWNARRRRLQLTGFGIACELAKEMPGIEHPAILEGSLPYMAPEQTGRMNRIIDYRADYYAVGATFYELLTGQPPFDTCDAMELVHCHIARAPDWTLPALAGLSGSLLAVLQKLLEKNAEERYQTIGGLTRDLERCRGGPEHAARQRCGGLSDHSGVFHIPQKLYGRESEVATLLAAFERSAGGGSEMLLVAGYSGIGKSALVNEIHKPVVARRGCFVSGKFDQYQRDVPYASLIQAFQELIRQLLSEPAERVLQWAVRLRAALGAGIGVIAELIPELQLIVGPTDAVATLPPLESQNRLNRLFQRFVQVFSGAGHPLVVFLDDLQWADPPTLKMIELFMRDPDERHLLFIGAYRDNEVDVTHPLMVLRDDLLQAGVRLTTLTLTALTEQHVAELNADTLGASAGAVASLSRLCHQKTLGNPFFLNQFLHAIHEAGQLRYDFDQDGWRWDMEALEHAGYSDNVVELMLGKIRRLPPPTQQLLQLAASIGNRFELDTLAVIAQQSPHQIQSALWPALKADLIHPLSGHYKYLEQAASSSQIHYRFLHDRVQQAAYSVAAEAEQQQHHLSIGRLLLRHTTAATLDEQLLTVVEQLNAGRSRITARDEQWQLAGLNHKAGLRARRSAAWQAALRHMRIGLSLLSDQAWDEQFDLCLALHLDGAEASYLCGEFAAAEALYPVALAHCATALDTIRCYVIESSQYLLQGRYLEAIAVQRAGLQLLQIDMPIDEAGLQASMGDALAAIEALSADRTMRDILLAGEMRDPADLAAMQLLHNMWLAGYLAGQQTLSMSAALSMTRLSLQQGNSDRAPFAYTSYAYIIIHRTQQYERGYQFGAMAVALADSRASLQIRALTYFIFATFVNHWSRPLQHSDRYFEDAFGWAVESGDFVTVAGIATVRAAVRLIHGHYLPDLLQSVQRDIALMRRNGQIDLADCATAGVLQPVKILMGQAARPDSYDDAEFEEARYLAVYAHGPLHLAYFYGSKIRNAYLFDCAQAEELAGHCSMVEDFLPGHATPPEAVFYAAMIWLRALRRQPQRADAPALLARCEALQAKLAAWAAQCPDNFAARYLLTQAEAARLRHDMPAAVRSYREALTSARAAGYLNLAALGNELCGEYWAEQGEADVAGLFLHDALQCYRQWGAEGKVAQLMAREAMLPAGAGRRWQGADAPASGPSGAALDLQSIVKASQALASQIGLRRVLERLIEIVRENSGAQVARLLLLQGEVWRIEADIAGEGVTVLQARSVALDAESDPQFPLSMLRYAVRAGVEVIEDRMSAAPKFAADPYVLAHRPRSVMCLPIKQAGRICGLLYLENKLTDGSFTAERVEFLRILSTQALISIDHARLHDDLEQRVEERTGALANSLSVLTATIESTADGILATNLASGVICFNTQFQDMWGIPSDMLERGSDAELIAFIAPQVRQSEPFISRAQEVLAHADTDSFDVLELKDGRIFERYCRPQRIDGKAVGIVVNCRDVTVRMRAERELREAQSKLLATARQAGMAEIATNVLHNVGNVLNSVAVSADLVSSQVRASKAVGLNRAVQLMNEHAADLGDFLTRDQKGKQLPEYLNKLAEALRAEQTNFLEELGQLSKSIEHIKDIVATQQSYAGASCLAEPVQIRDLVEDALRMNAGSLARHEVTVVREFADVPLLPLDRHRLLQILVNLIGNAKQAMDGVAGPSHQMTLRVALADGANGRSLLICVADKGEGIAAENLTRIFSHGFTTRQHGHGFGLHSCALAAIEMGGTLSAHSDGPGLGASFTLALPIRAAEVAV